MTYDPKLEEAYSFLQSGQYRLAYDELKRLEFIGHESSELWKYLGWLNQAGYPIASSERKAIEYYKKAENLGDSLSSYYIGNIYREAGDIQSAIEHYHKSALAGHSSSNYWLGTLYMRGDSGERELDGALRHLRLAEAEGHVFAKRDLALAAIRGTFGRRAILSGVYKYLKAMLGGFYIAFKNTDDHRLG